MFSGSYFSSSPEHGCSAFPECLVTFLSYKCVLRIDIELCSYTKKGINLEEVNVLVIGKLG